MTWIDISQTLWPGMTSWPGDPAFSAARVMSIAAGDQCNLGTITLCLHTGTHADAPRHFEAGGSDVAECALDVFLGVAEVVEATSEIPIGPKTVQALPPGRLERVLFKTGSGVEQGWHEKFSYLTEAAARELVRRGTRLIGLDTPSVDAADSSRHESHRLFARAGVVVLENLNLMAVGPGRYELVALPLKLANLEASPVRAVLRPLSGPSFRSGPA